MEINVTIVKNAQLRLKMEKNSQETTVRHR